MEIIYVPRILKITFSHLVNLPEDQLEDSVTMRSLSAGEFQEIQHLLLACTPLEKDSLKVKRNKMRSFFECQIIQAKLCVLELVIKGKKINNPDYTTIDNVLFDIIIQHMNAFNYLSEQSKFKPTPQVTQQGSTLVN